MVLKKIDEGQGRQVSAQLAARLSLAVRRWLALVGEAFGQCARNVLSRIVVAVVPGVFAGQQHVPGVVVVVIPLRTIMPRRRVFVRCKQARDIVGVLQHEMNVAAALTRQSADRKAQVTQNVWFARCDDRMHRVETQPVEPVVTQPVHRVLDREPSHVRNAIVDGAAPRCLRV